jgi:hypothetical protein
VTKGRETGLTGCQVNLHASMKEVFIPFDERKTIKCENGLRKSYQRLDMRMLLS